MVIVARVEPHRLLLDSDCWWDVGVAELSERPETRELAAEHARGRRASAALPPTTVRIVATAEVPPVAREAFARLGEIEVVTEGHGHAIAGAES